MAGALFVITIPTEEEEKRLRNISLINRNNKISTLNNSDTNALSTINLPSASIATPSSIIQKTKSAAIKYFNSPTINSACPDIQYGTFHNQKKNSPSSTTIKIKINNEINKIPSEKNEYKINEKSLSSQAKLDSNEIQKNPGFNKTENLPSEIELSSISSMEIILKEVLKQLKIENSTWTKSNNEKSYQIVFSIEYNEKYETLMKKLNEWGIGDRDKSSVSILHCSSFNYSKGDSSSEDDDSDFKEAVNVQKQSAWNRFMNTFTARLKVEQIVRNIREEASITFDFIILLISAAFLASFGLIGDNTIFLASSMLVSPLMGPVIATIFGTAVKDHSLLNLGLINEFIGIVLATIVGYIFGVIMCIIDDKYETDDGFTTEILSRCELNSLLIGVLTAIPSGAAAAIGVLGGNIGSLVGVAISASILPPAVNSGIVWAFASICMIYESDNEKFNFSVKTKLYSNSQTLELFIRGTISMCITLSNVICIYVMGIIVLKVKEITPISQNNRRFWKHDIKIARNLNKSHNENIDNESIDQEINKITSSSLEDGKSSPRFKSKFLNPYKNINFEAYQNTWSPMGNKNRLFQIYNNQSTDLKDLEKIYMSIAQGNLEAERKLKDSIGLSLINSTNQENLFYDRNCEVPCNYRRASMPSESYRKHQCRSVINKPLEKLWEEKDSISNSNIDKNRKFPRKFTVTPASTENPLE